VGGTLPRGEHRRDRGAPGLDALTTNVSRESDRSAGNLVEAVARRSYGKLIAFLAARTRDIAGAEDALSEAFAVALEAWVTSGVPTSPEAWLLTVARRKMIDAARRQKEIAGGSDLLEGVAAEIAAASSDEKVIPDDRLALMFVCAHPAIDPAVRAPLMLQTTLGLDAGTIASAFLVAPATMSQRLVRAKSKIKEAGIPFRVPDRADLPQRLGTVLDAVYAAFAEGWLDPAGSETRRRNLAEEGIWLGRLLVELMPDEPEALGLLALMLHAEARRNARRDADGEYVPLAKQNPDLWDASLIDEAEALLLRASARGAIGRYQLEAALQSVHAARRHTGSTDWKALLQIYDALAALTESPVVAVNRAVALSESDGPAAGLAALELLAEDARLSDYQPYWAARAELSVRAGEVDAAKAAFERAIGLERDPAVRRFLQRRLDEVTRSPVAGSAPRR
jgi:RNA polymerase sigma-70 factor (ECF subfamily)